MRKLICLVALSFICLQNYSFADTPEIETPGDYMAGIGTKFGRGIENIVTSPAEIPCTIGAETHEGDRTTHFFTGLGKGTVFFLRRAFVGVTEAITFFIPMERTIPRVCTEKPLAE